MERTLRNAFRRIVRGGDVIIKYPSGHQQQLGDRTGAPVIACLTERGVRALAWDPPLALGETYMEGDLTFEAGDLMGFVTILKKGGIHRGWTPGAVLNHVWRSAKSGLHQRAGITKARRNIAHHYDLSEQLYRLFLDKDMNYTCAYFEHEGQSLEAAQLAKKRHIAAKLLSKPGNTVAELGCGWGGMGLYLAQVCELDVTAVTLSSEQQRVAEQRAVAAGMGDRARFELKDYRQVTGSYDHVVSVGMLEHVGRPQLKTCFKKVAALLKKDGTAVFHSMAQPKPQPYAQPFGDKYIFPGGYVPSLAEILPAVEAAGLLIKDIEILPMHYAETCRIWRERFMANREQVLELYDERFIRMWEMYLIGAEVGFRHDRIFIQHLVLARHQDRIPIRRGWIDREKDRLRAREAAAGIEA